MSISALHALPTLAALLLSMATTLRGTRPDYNYVICGAQRIFAALGVNLLLWQPQFGLANPHAPRPVLPTSFITSDLLMPVRNGAILVAIAVVLWLQIHWKALFFDRLINLMLMALLLGFSAYPIFKLVARRMIENGAQPLDTIEVSGWITKLGLLIPLAFAGLALQFVVSLVRRLRSAPAE